MAFGFPRIAVAAFGDRIVVAGTEFKAGGDRIWINGANTPWHTWNECGGNFDAAWWDRHFGQLHKSGINATRVWLSCDGGSGIEIDSAGYVSGCTERFWKNVDILLDLARKNQIYIDATLLSFDHFSDGHRHYESWRKMLADDRNVDSIVNNYVLPFAMRYRDNPWLWCVDLCNEPDWIHENAKCGKLQWDGFQTYAGRAAAAIHAHTPILVTVGFCMGPKYTGAGPRRNVLSDAALQAKSNGDPRARIDFYSPHYYDWESTIAGNAFYKTPSEYHLDANKPCLIGECQAKGSAHHAITEDYESAFSHGWQGVMAWSSDGVDDVGSLSDFSPATEAMRASHGALIFPH